MSKPIAKGNRPAPKRPSPSNPPKNIKKGIGTKPKPSPVPRANLTPGTKSPDKTVKAGTAGKTEPPARPLPKLENLFPGESPQLKKASNPNPVAESPAEEAFVPSKDTLERLPKFARDLENFNPESRELIESYLQGIQGLQGTPYDQRQAGFPDHLQVRRNNEDGYLSYTGEDGFEARLYDNNNLSIRRPIGDNGSFRETSYSYEWGGSPPKPYDMNVSTTTTAGNGSLTHNQNVDLWNSSITPRRSNNFQIAEEG